ncbi:hypothetical protein [Pseudopedobacter beijingensis]|uniref:Transcription elongation factor, GreA/GreB, C-term n=1 Tax=Pseudopedobacter beijingensis TaxID=1207056 RepID=A0ABW4I7J9_9SPHI
MSLNKTDIIQSAILKLEEKEYNLRSLIAQTRESNNDTKSSMGDKYETSREMLQQEINMLEKQLTELLAQKEQFFKIRAEDTKEVNLGALVKTSIGNLFIAAGIGELQVNGIKIMNISPLSPLAKEIARKKAGDSFVINGKQHQILDVK